LEDGASPPGRITISSSPVPPDQSRNLFETSVGKKLMASVLAAAMEAVSVVRAEQQLAARDLPALQPLGEALNRLHRRLRDMVLPDSAARNLWSLADLIVTTVRGILTDGLLTHPQGFSAINDQEYRHWIARHGASPETLDSPLVRGVYDLVFGFQDGDPDRPRFAAGLGLFLSGKLFFEYRGSIFWKPQGGMGDVFCAPLYEALTKRGVRFEFFSRVEAVRPALDGRSIATVEVTRQVRLPGGPANYQPLVEVGGLPCFPSRPNLPDDLAPRLDYESIWARSEDGDATVLEQGRDFDRLVLAIPVGMLPHICTEIIAADPRWKAMVERVGTVATQVFQLWLTASPTELGWDRPGVTMTGFYKPFETWSLMEHLLNVEQWPTDERPRTLAYFCSTLATTGGSSYDDPEYPKREHEHVRDSALAFLRDQVRHFWPGAVDESDTFRWDLLAGGGDRTGEDRFDSQFWRANVDPSEHYVLSLPGSDKYRLRADESGYENLVLAGDWIDCGLNAGCLEAAVMSGFQAANVLTGKPITDRIGGYYLDWGK
jgi:uncharacterized protein with NAD-binding domain and iron-sulfur cluster